jgi:hypothetical protein
MKLKRVRAGIAFGSTRNENFLFNLSIRSLNEYFRYSNLRSDGSLKVQMLLPARHILFHTHTHTHTNTYTYTQRSAGACYACHICFDIVLCCSRCVFSLLVFTTCFSETSCFLAAKDLIFKAEYYLNQPRNTEIKGTKLFTSLSNIRLSLSSLS